MNVPVVQVRPVSVSMFRRAVLVRMDVQASRRCSVMFVVVMPIVVPMPVLMNQRVVPVYVAVTLAEEKNQRPRYENSCHRLRTRERLTKEDERQEQSEERSCRECDLAAGRAQSLSRRDVQRDAHAVSERARYERQSNCAEVAYTAQHHAAHNQIEKPCDHALPECRLRRRDAIDQSGEMVVEAPRQACACHEQGREYAGLPLAHRQEYGCNNRAQGADPAPPGKVLSENETAKKNCGHKLQAQEE